jgi:YHYH protein
MRSYALLVLPAFFAMMPRAAIMDAAPKAHDVLDVHHLILGDGRVATAPKAGFVMSCQTDFSGGFGPPGVGPWIHDDPIHGKTWDLTEKAQAAGKVMWPEAQFSIERTQDGVVVSRVVKGNGLPVKTATGTFPIGADDPAARYDRNPNSIQKQSVALTLAGDPQAAAQPACVPMGMIGVALNGVAIFNALDSLGRDAVAHEVQDLCSGHPEPRGMYHYHGPSACLPGEMENEQLIGYALDGFGIYSMYDAVGRELTDADLDACHGRMSPVLWDGSVRTMYHYVLTREYPYTIGCFMGTPQRVRGGGPPRGGGRGPGGGSGGDRPFRGPPPM